MGRVGATVFFIGLAGASQSKGGFKFVVYVGECGLSQFHVYYSSIDLSPRAMGTYAGTLLACGDTSFSYLFTRFVPPDSYLGRC